MPVNKEENGTWTSRFYVTDYKGERKQKKRRGFATKREAQEFEREFLAKSNLNLDMSFQSLYDLYMEDMKHRLKQHTFISKEYIINLKILPFFKKLSIDKISPVVIRKWQNELINSKNPKTNKKYAPTYIKTINNQLSAMMNYAVKFYGLKENPCHKAGSIGKKNADEMKIWEPPEFEKFINLLVHKPVSYTGFQILFNCGLRIGELLALTVKDINLKNKTLKIDKSYQRLRKKDIVTDPKTPRANRVIDMSDKLVSIVEEYIQRLYCPTDDTRLFPTTKSTFEHDIKTYSAKAGLEKIRLQDLRHSHASFLINNNVNILAVSKRLGHEKVETTLNIYAHLFRESHDFMISVLNK